MMCPIAPAVSNRIDDLNSFIMALKKEILDALHRGDRKAYTTIYELFHEMILVTAYKILRSKEDAEEVTGDTFKALMYKKDFEDETHVGPWLYTVARNRSITKLNERNRLAKLITTVDPEKLVLRNFMDEASAERTVETRAAQAMAALEKLPEKQRKIAFLRFVQGKSLQEIADTLRIHVSTVKTQVTRARKTIEKHSRGNP